MTNSANLGGVTIGLSMADRPVFHKDLGEFFKDLRDSKGWSQRQAATIAKNRRIAGVSYQVLQRLEAGKTKNPEPQLLRALAMLYDRAYDELVFTWVSARFGTNDSDLIRPTAERSSSPSERRPDDPASVEGDEARRVQSRLEEYVAATEEVANRLFELVAEHRRAAQKGDRAVQAGTGVRRRAREAR